jgi:hypothetical protein
MLNCNHLLSYELSVQLVDGKLRLSPPDKVTDEIKKYIRQNRDALISELKENESIQWYLSNRHTLNPDDNLTGYKISKLSEPMELVDLILKVNLTIG